MDDDGAPALETRAAARLLGIRIRALYDLIDRGELPPYKDGRNIKLRQADVEGYRRSHPTRG